MSMAWMIVTAVLAVVVSAALIPIQGLALPLLFEAAGHAPPERREALLTAVWIAAATLVGHLLASLTLLFVPGIGLVVLIVDIAIAGAIVHHRHGVEPVMAGKIGAGLYLIGVVAGMALSLGLQPIAVWLTRM